MKHARNSGQLCLICLGLAVAIAVVYGPVRGFEFVEMDDPAYVRDNGAIQNGLNWPAVQWAFTSGHCSNWHPLTWLSHTVDWNLFGNNPAGHHLVAVLFHMANTLLLFCILKKMTSAIWRSAFVAALFGLHPLHVESVAWISERKDVLSTFFWMLTMWAYVRYAEMRAGGQVRKRESGSSPSRSLSHFLTFYSLALLFFALGLMCKSMLVTLPFVLLLLDFWPLRRAMSGKLLLEKIPFFLLTVLSSTATYLAQNKGGAVASLHKLALGPRVANAFISYAAYIKNFLWPKNLAPLYPHPGQWPASYVAVSIMVLLLMTAIIFWQRARRPFLAVGWLWFLGTLVPVIGLVQIGVHAYADRYTYVPLIGLCIMVAWGVPELIARWPGRKLFLTVSTTAVLIACMVLTRKQISYWQNTGTLFAHELEAAAENEIAHDTLGYFLARQGKIDEAIAHYRRALQLNSDYTVAHNNLAFAYSQQHRLDEAIAEYTMSLQRKPDDAQVENNLATAYADQAKWDNALLHYAKAAGIDPQNAEAHYNWALALSRIGKLDDAIQHYNEAIRIRPDYADAHGNLGNLLLRQGKIAEAREQYLISLKWKPNDVTAHNNLGSTYIRENKFAEAITSYREALRCNPASLQAHFNLGLALSRIGQRDAAAAEFQEALRLKPDFAEARQQLNQLGGK